MAESFNELRERLLRAGVAPRHVRRYLGELADHMADLRADEERAGRRRTDAESAALIRLGGMDDLSKAMIERRQFQSWCVRAPWATFGLAPLFLLAGAYFVACLVLWSGWKIFLPGADTPFVPLDGLAILYFGLGRWLYFSAPVLIGWGIGLMAARQRFRAAWPTIGLALVALVGGTAEVHASHPAVPGKVGHISMDLALGTSLQGFSRGLFHVLMIFLLTLVPCLLWRLKEAHSSREA
jgi:hypothetical protein